MAWTGEASYFSHTTGIEYNTFGQLDSDSALCGVTLANDVDDYCCGVITRKIIPDENNYFDAHSGYGIVHKSKYVGDKTILEATGGGDTSLWVCVPTALSLELTGDLVSGMYEFYRGVTFIKKMVVQTVEQNGQIKFYAQDVISTTEVNDRLFVIEQLLESLTSE